MAAIARTPAAGEPTATSAGTGSFIDPQSYFGDATYQPVATSDPARVRLTPTALTSFHARTPVGTEGVAGLLTGWVAVPRGSSQVPGATSDPAGMQTVYKAAAQRAERFGLPQEAIEPLVSYFRSNSGKFPELTDLATGGSGNYSAAASAPGFPGSSAVLPWFQNTNMLIAIGAAGVALVLLLRGGRKR